MIIHSGKDGSKVAKQNITYESTTGKVYEELGCSGTGSGGGQNQTNNTTNNAVNLDPSRQPVQPTTSATADYSSQYQNYQQAYSYGQVPSQYMGSFGGAYSANQFNPYDRYDVIITNIFVFTESLNVSFNLFHELNIIEGANY